MDTLRSGTPINPRIGVRIQNARRRRKWTQKELADRAGTSFAVISRLETGRQSVSAERLAVIARLLGLSMDNLCQEEPNPGEYRATAVGQLVSV
jgi:transcriptional regulator with XRE-family HTH domain